MTCVSSLGNCVPTFQTSQAGKGLVFGGERQYCSSGKAQPTTNQILRNDRIKDTTVGARIVILLFLHCVALVSKMYPGTKVLSCLVSLECTLWEGFFWRMPEQAYTVPCRASHPRGQGDQVLCT